MVHEQGDMIGKNVSRVFFCSQTVKNSNMDHLEDVGALQNCSLSMVLKSLSCKNKLFLISLK